jgi:hypothetical protein
LTSDSRQFKSREQIPFRTAEFGRSFAMTTRLIRRAAVQSAIIIYSIAAFLALDFGYSMFITNTTANSGTEASPRIAVAQYDHGLAANFDGHVRWSGYNYTFYTNNLGLRDAVVRDVPLRSDVKRVLLIGDSMLEGMGVTFEDSFAGLLYAAGRENSKSTEFLNAGTVSNSPVIYYRKIRYLLESGLRFDEVIVFSDISDIQDEATNYFCLDDEPHYLKYCGMPRPPSTVTQDDKWIQEHLLVTYAVVSNIHSYFHDPSDYWTRFINQRAGWTIPGYDVGDSYAPLGVEGGVARSRKNMQAMADLLTKYGIALTIVVYPWPFQLENNDRDCPQVALWREFCLKNCKAFIDLFPAFFREKDAHHDWRETLFVHGDVHLSVAGNKFVYHELRKHLLAQ